MSSGISKPVAPIITSYVLPLGIVVNGKLITVAK